MQKRTPLGICKHCNLEIPYGSAGNIPFCSSRCRLESQEVDYILKLSQTRDEIKWSCKRNYFWPEYNRIIDIGDTHFPFIHPVKLEKFFQYVEAIRPKLGPLDFFIQGGDLHDFFSGSRFDRTHSLYTPDQEFKLSKQLARDFWKRIHKAHPSAVKIQIKGNHDDRPAKRLIEKAPELEPFYKDDEMFLFDKVETVLDSNQRVFIKDILFQHGHSQGGRHMIENLMKTATHHTHRGGTWFHNLQGQIIWELNSGYLGDPESTPLKYNPRRWANWTHGFGEIINDVPKFHPL